MAFRYVGTEPRLDSRRDSTSMGECFGGDQVGEYTSELPPSTMTKASITKDVIKEYRRFDTKQLVAPPKDVITRLPDKCFSVWVVEAPPLQPADLSEQRPLEEQILEL